MAGAYTMVGTSGDSVGTSGDILAGSGDSCCCSPPVASVCPGRLTGPFPSAVSVDSYVDGTIDTGCPCQDAPGDFHGVNGFPVWDGSFLLINSAPFPDQVFYATDLSGGDAGDSWMIADTCPTTIYPSGPHKLIFARIYWCTSTGLPFGTPAKKFVMIIYQGIGTPTARWTGVKDEGDDATGVYTKVDGCILNSTITIS